MNVVKVRNVVIGEGIPKICVPIVGTTEAEIFEEARLASELGADVVEFRADWFENVRNHDSLKSVLTGLREIAGDIPVLLTIRTSDEGGELDISDDDYADIIVRAVHSGLVDLVDAEVCKESGICRKIIDEAHAAGVKVIASYHDFSMTPDKSIILNRLCRMQETGADIIKIAVMPKNSSDVISLMDATVDMISNYAKCPVIAISMSESGTVSRLACEALGTAMTFGAASKASAPGQLSVDDLRHALSVFHRALLR